MIVQLILAILVAVSFSLTQGAAGSGDVHFLWPNLQWLTNSSATSFNAEVQASIDGFDAALVEINSKGGVHNGTRRLVKTEVNASNTQKVMDVANNSSFIAIVGWFMLRDQRDDSEAFLQQHNLLALGASSYDPAFFDWHPQFVNFFEPRELSIYAEVSYLLGNLKLKRVCTLMRDSSGVDGYGDRYELEVIRSAFSALDMEPVCHLSIKKGETLTNIGFQTLGILQYKPQAIILVGVPQEEMAAVLGALELSVLGLPPGLIMIGTNLWQSVALATYPYLNMTQGSGKIRIVSAMSSPAPSEEGTSRFARRCNAALKAYRGGTHNATTIEMSSYNIARFLIELLEKTTDLSRSGLRKKLYSNTIVEVDELSHGMFSDKQDVNNVVLPIGRCNQGGRAIEMQDLTLNLTPRGLGKKHRFQMSSIQCQPTSREIRRPVYVPTIIRDSDPSSFTSELANFQSMIVNGTHGLAYTHIPDCDVLTYPNRLGGSAEDKSENIASFDATYDQLQYEKNVMVHMAPQVATVAELPTECTLDKSFGAFIDPVPMVPELAVSGRSDILYFNPTLDQQIFALAESIAASSAGTSTVLLMHDSVSGAVASAAAQAFYTWGISGPSTARFASDTLDSTALAKGASANFLIVLGVQTTAEAQAIVAFLAANSAVTVMLEYQEYTRHYLALSAHASYSPSLASRIVFASSFPPLMGNTTVLERNFHLNLGADVAPTPLLQQGYIMGRALASILERMSKGTSGFEFLETLLKTAVVGIEGGIRFGPLSNVSEEGSGGCPMGARSVFVFGSGSSTTVSTTVFTSCSVPYTYAQQEALGAAVIALIVGLLIFLLIVVTLVISTLLLRGYVRDTTNAPKDSSKPFAVMFTDIEASTALWSRHPVEMGPALDSHHELIRKLIKKHKAYEVKTIGDSFLIVHRNPIVLVQLAKELQEDFYTFNWGSSNFDEAYKDAELLFYEQAVNQAKVSSNDLLMAITAAAEPPTANDEDYSSKWNGLRVRTGVHYGTGEIQFDNVSKGYDYYGNVVNTASRIEGATHGGQIVISQDVLQYLNENGQGPKDLSNLGRVLLRGVTEPLELIQLNYRNRKFKPIPERAVSGPGISGDGAGAHNPLAESHRDNLDQPEGASSETDEGSTKWSAGMVAKKYLHGQPTRLKIELNYSHSLLSLMISPAPEGEKREIIKKLATRWRVDHSMLTKADITKDLALDWAVWSVVARVTKVHQETLNTSAAVGDGHSSESSRFGAHPRLSVLLDAGSSKSDVLTPTGSRGVSDVLTPTDGSRVVRGNELRVQSMDGTPASVSGKDNATSFVDTQEPQVQSPLHTCPDAIADDKSVEDY